MASAMQLASLALCGLTFAPLFVRVEPNFNCILTACLTVFIGCYRSMKPNYAPSETMSKESAMRFPLVGSAALLSLFILFKFLPKDIVNGVLSAYFVVLGIIALTATISPCLDTVLPNRFKDACLTIKLPCVESFQLTLSDLISGVPSTAFCVWYLFKRHWLGNNVLGIAFSVGGIEMLSLGSFKIGAILLVGLFFYDIFWVFFTPVMVSVAKSFDAPVKLLFPTGNSVRPYSMLGLGDIVIPGIFVALALRFDASRKKGPCYFKSAFSGYVAGLVATIAAMNWFQAAQPALLYIVPGIIGFLIVHCMARGEMNEVLAYDESSSEVNQKTSEEENSSNKTD